MPRSGLHRNCRAAWVLVAVGSVMAAACSGSQAHPTTVGASRPTSGTTTSTSVVTTSIAPATSTTAFSARIVPFRPRVTVAFAAGTGMLTVVGGAIPQAQAPARFSAGSCAQISVSEATGWLASLTFASAPGSPSGMTFVVDFADGAWTGSPGSQVYPLPDTLDPMQPRQVRFSVAVANGSGAGGTDFLNWGTEGPGVASGQLTLVKAGSWGSFDLALPFVGDDRGSVPASSRPPVHVVGNFECSNNVMNN
jgi:hypothetical protein